MTLNNSTSWELRYRTLENTFEQAMTYLANAEPQLAEIVKIHEKVFADKFEVVVQCSGASVRYAFWIYQNGELVLKIPYSYKNSVEFIFKKNAQYRIRIFLAAGTDSEAFHQHDYSLKGNG